MKLPPYARNLIDDVRALRGARLIIVATMVGFVGFLLWATLARVDEVTRGQGRVIPSSKVQVIQPSQPASIRAILVRGGQSVKKGQLLVRLDDTESSSELGQIEAESQSLEARAARLTQEASGQGFGCPESLRASNPEACESEAALQQLRSNALRSRLNGLSAAVEQRRRDLSEAQATASSLRTSLQLANEQVAMLEPLAAKSIVPQTELLQARREAQDIRGRLAAAQEAISRNAAAIREAQAQLSEADLQFRQEALDERNQLSAKLAVNEESLRGAAGRLERSEIRSPVDGVINDVQINTVGGFVSAGQKIMEVVPAGEKLLVEARVQPRDIAFINVGDPAIVKVTAYDFSIYGGLNGKVVNVSADSIYDEEAKEAYFTVLVETDRAFLEAGKSRLPITPGMICDVEIITGRKSVLAYLLKPVNKARSEALRER
ncbi:MAG TPA: HlyD family type I secretion periplasmic adaptor subunit [Caulobacteraceae bacterium]|nr:HlyD family type I secretion periplasmic adaptor subunit [Caulobacteraceae bacterium]